MIYGYYPEIVIKNGEEKTLLKTMAGSYLYKDLLMLDYVKKPVLLEKILKALALQVGSEVSYNEISKLVNADKETVEKYIDLLEKTYVIFRLSAFSRNIRNEIKKSRKIYFWDNGIRNAVIGNFDSIYARTDTGALWENFVISERMKLIYYSENNISSYFWRTTSQQEIDYVEEQKGKLYAFEIKWNPRSKVIFPKTFINEYQVLKKKVISPENIEEFLQGGK
jgi:hypothetical protein